MEFQKITCDRVGQCYYTAKHSSGVTVYVYPKEGYRSVCAYFGTKYGSADVRFKLAGDSEFTEVPAGVAHFLEHKLFEKKDYEVTEKFAELGASSNAFTGFDRTCYHFSCTENFEKAFELLLDFVQHPYFTAETVQKEQGIIAQEINMYLDDPSFCSLFNMIKGLYHVNPVKTEIAGSVQSIAQITPELLYKCYDTFYTPENMVIAVAGNTTPEQVGEICERMLLPRERHEIIRSIPDEPETVVEQTCYQHFDVANPLFTLGFKLPVTKCRPEELIYTDIMLYALFGKTSDFYVSALKKGLINTTFVSESYYLDNARVILFGGESADPEAVRDAIFAEIRRARSEGISAESFECAKRSFYGGSMSSLNVVDGIASTLADCHFLGLGSMFDSIEHTLGAGLDEVQRQLERINLEHSTLSVVAANK